MFTSFLIVHQLSHHVNAQCLLIFLTFRASRMYEDVIKGVGKKFLFFLLVFLFRVCFLVVVALIPWHKLLHSLYQLKAVRAGDLRLSAGTGIWSRERNLFSR